MRNRKIWAAFVSAAFSLSAGAAQADVLGGLFNTGTSDRNENQRGTLNIEFHACEEDPALSCGTVKEFIDPAPDAVMVLPDGSPMVGFTMIKGLKDKGKGKFRGGKINALDESIEKGEMVWYGVKINKVDDGTLEIKGCLGPFCPRTLVWTPVAHEDVEASSDKTAQADEENIVTDR
ncbi:MAG: DUF2147 domain-containing protein [Pseudomonadota bacterium]